MFGPYDDIGVLYDNEVIYANESCPVACGHPHCEERYVRDTNLTEWDDPPPDYFFHDDFGEETRFSDGDDDYEYDEIAEEIEQNRREYEDAFSDLEHIYC